MWKAKEQKKISPFFQFKFFSHFFYDVNFLFFFCLPIFENFCFLFLLLSIWNIFPVVCFHDSYVLVFFNYKKKRISCCVTMSFWQIVLVVGKKNSYLLIEMNLRQKHFFCIFLFDSSFVLRYYARLKKNIIRSTSPLFAIFSIGLFPCLKNYRIKVYVFE